MRIQLIHPPIYFNPSAVQATRPSMPLGLAYIAAALREDGHTVSMIDAAMAAPEQVSTDGRLQYLGLRPEEIAADIHPDTQAVGISVLFSFTWPLVRQIIRHVRDSRPDLLIVGGGEHFNGLPEYSLRDAPLDYLVLGEGEETVRELFRALEQDAAVDQIPGLAFLRGGAYVQTPRRERIRDVDAIPWPAWDLFDPKAYYAHGHVMGVNAGMAMPILATRGCPYACTFCSNAEMWRRCWRARAPEHVVDEIEAYHRRYGAVSFPFHDLTAILRRDWMIAFCEILARRKLNISWQLPVGTRCEVIDEEVAAWLQRTGCHAITFAPESGSERTRKLVGKRLKEPGLIRAVRASVRHGLAVSNFFVAGFPHDTAADMRQSVRLAFRLGLAGAHDIALSIFFPIPGTQLYRELEAAGRISLSDETLLAPIFSMDAVLDEKNNFCAHMSAAAVTRWKYSILLVFFLTQFIARPWRPAQLLWNVFRDKETCRLDIFLNERKRRCLRRFQRHAPQESEKRV